MAGNTKAIVKDVDQKPSPQYFNPNTDAYEYLFGRNGANRVEIYGPDGAPLSITTGKLDVRSTEIETILNTLATQATLASLLGQADITTSALRDALRGLDNKTLSDLATLLTAIRDTTGVKKITDPVDVADRAARVLGKVTADDNAITALGALAASAVTNPASAASVIALLKGLLKQLQGTGAGSQPVNISTAIPAGDNNIGRAKITDGTTITAVDAATQRLKTDTILTGSIETVNVAPVVGVKTITATAAEVFAGGSIKANRRKMIVKNEDAVLRFRVGPSSVTQQNGFPVEPGATVEFQFDPNVAVAIYAIAEGASLEAAVMEI